MSLPCGDMGAEKGDPINLFRPRIISSWAWSYFTVEKRKKTSISKFNSGVARFFLGCEAVSNQNTQQAFALPEKEVIQPHLPVRLPCYDFTPVTSPAFGTPPPCALGFDGGLKKPPTDALRPIIPDNACILCITAAAGTELADAYSPDTVIASSPGKEVHDPWAFYLHAALLRQAFAHCGKFPTAASRRSLGRVSVPVWLIILSDQLLIIALVSYCLTN
ncbi:ATP synthase subunit alpha [Melia azedarach]|nr:ATP synthase subunit alpha [Melia azedarach]